MLINIVTPQIANGASLLYEGYLRCRDRGCTCNRKRTKQLLQEDYEDINTKSDFLLEFRYSQLLTTIFMVFMYSSGMPILYPIAAASFFSMYICDKLFRKSLRALIIHASPQVSQEASSFHAPPLQEDAYDPQILNDTPHFHRPLYVH